MSIEVIENGSWADLIKSFRAVKDASVEIGIFKDAGSKILLKARVNEFGSRRQINLGKKTIEIVIPERSFIRSTFDDPKTIQEVVAVANEAMEKFIQGGGNVLGILDAIGGSIVTAIQTRIKSGIEPKNTKGTLRKKKMRSSTALINTGEMLDHIEYRITHD